MILNLTGHDYNHRMTRIAFWVGEDWNNGIYRSWLGVLIWLSIESRLNWHENCLFPHYFSRTTLREFYQAFTQRWSIQHFSAFITSWKKIQNSTFILKLDVTVWIYQSIFFILHYLYKKYCIYYLKVWSFKWNVMSKIAMLYQHNIQFLIEN